MAIQKFDEINLRAVPYEQYFGEMGLDEEDYRRRIELAEAVEEIFVDVFGMIAYDYALGIDLDPEYYINYIVLNYEDLLWELGIDYVDEYPWLDAHINEVANEVIEQNVDNESELWETSDDRAKVIAENEANNVYEYKNFQDAVNGGKTEKTWITIPDDRVRHTHKMISGKTIPIMNRFKVGKYEMYHPDDRSLGAGLEETANCRCWCFYS